MQAYEYILIALSAGQFLAMIIGGYMFLQKPAMLARNKAESASDNIKVMEASCVLKHNRIDEIFNEIKKQMGGIEYTFQHFKENEFDHIEGHSKDINIRMAAMEGKMDTLIMLTRETLTKK